MSGLAEARTLDDLWNNSLKAVGEALGFDYASILVVDNTDLIPLASFGTPIIPMRIPIAGKGITARAARTREPQLVKDTRLDPDFFAGSTDSLSELAVPIVEEGRTIAVLNVEGSELNAFDVKDQRFLQLLASDLSLNVTLLKRGNSLEALYRYTNRLAEVDTLDEAAAVTNDAIRELLKTSSGSLSLVAGDELHFRYIYGPRPDEEFRIPVSGRGITARTARTGEAQLVVDVTEDPDYVKPPGFDTSTRSEFTVPVRVGGRVFAVINAENPSVNAFTQGDVEMLEIFANHLGSTISRISESEDKKRYRARLELLHELILLLDGAQTEIEALDASVYILKQLYGSEYDNIALVEGNQLVSHRHETKLVQRQPLDGGRGITVRAANEGRTVIVGDTSADPAFVPGEIAALSELVVPLKIQGSVVGILNLESTRRNAYNVEDAKLAETLALHISSTLARIRLAEERRRALEKAMREEAAAERARELAAVRTRFLSMATHEIRTPLTSITGYTELVEDALQIGDTSNLRSYFSSIRRNTERLARLTRDLMDVQRIEESRMSLSKSSVATGCLLDDLVEQTKPLLMGRGQKLDMADALRGELEIDRDRLVQVLVNLVTNASKFSPTGSTIKLIVKKRGNEALFSIRDKGIGLSREDIPKLFKPFPGILVEGNKEGTGLGLSICRGIVELHGGRIWAESAGIRKGAVFSFTIPIRASDG